MRTDVLQAIALSAHGAAFLRHGERAPELLTSHSTFRSVHAIEFRRSGSLHGGLIAESVSPWLRRLSAEGVVMIRPVIAPCSLAGEAPAAVWGVLTDGDRGMEIWRPHWRARLAGHDDAKPYRVTYTAERMSRWHLPPMITPEAAFQDLAAALIDSVEHLKRYGHPERAFPLVRCLELQVEGDGDFSGTSDLWPDDYVSEGRSLSATALRVALVASSSYAHAPGALRTEVYEKLWGAAMRAFEAAVPTVNVAVRVV